MFEYLETNHKVLDIAIGTGLDAVLFKKAGTRVYGIDGASEMLKICAEKNAAHELKKVDFLNSPIPYGEDYFDHVIANSIFHMVEDPTPVFKETSRVLRKEGIFGFTFDEMTGQKTPSYQKTGRKGISRMQHPESGLFMYRHAGEFMENLSYKHGFTMLKKTDFLVFRGKDGFDDFYFTAFILKKQ
jgi:ubiquinone/menaquinone biosynthesis C-methylase UbiE